MSQVASLQEYANLLEELKERKSHESQTYEPLKVQDQFHKANTWCRLLFGGNRSGKSRGAAQEIYYWFASSHPDQPTPKRPRIWVLSAEYRTIFEGIWSHLKAVIPPWTIERVGSKIPGWDIPSFIEAKSGARIDFISAQGGADTRRKLQAAEIDLLAVDEEISGDLWTELQARLLTKGGRVIGSMTLIESEEWLLQLEAEAEAGSPDVSVFRLNTQDNQYNDAIAFKRFAGSLSQDEYEVRILGKSRRSRGLVYSKWCPLTIGSDDRPLKGCHVVKPFTIPRDWNKWCLLDTGHRTAAAIWIAISPKGYCFGYREMYLHFTDLPEIVSFIKKAESTATGSEEIDMRLVDPAAWKKHADGSIGAGEQLANNYDLYFAPATSRDKMGAIEAARFLLLPDIEGIPQFRVFETLENFIMERRKYRLKGDRGKRDADAPADRPIKRHDHLMNCFEYFATHLPDYVAPKVSTIEELAQKDDSEIVVGREEKWRIRKMRQRTPPAEYAEEGGGL